MMFSGIMLKNVGMFKHIATAGLLLLLGVNVMETYGTHFFNIDTRNMLHFEKFGMFFNSIAIASTLIFVVLSGRDIELVGKNTPDLFALIFFVLCGIGIITSYSSLLMLFLGIEIISIPLYILTGSDKKNLKSNEAALKYFLMGSFSTGLMLMGIALIYGASGRFAIESVNVTAAVGPVAVSDFLKICIILILVSMAFKVSAAPFHFW